MPSSADTDKSVTSPSWPRQAVTSTAVSALQICRLSISIQVRGGQGQKTDPVPALRHAGVCIPHMGSVNCHLTRSHRMEGCQLAVPTFTMLSSLPVTISRPLLLNWMQYSAARWPRTVRRCCICRGTGISSRLDQHTVHQACSTRQV